jgi:hypothetical protein
MTSRLQKLTGALAFALLVAGVTTTYAREQSPAPPPPLPTQPAQVDVVLTRYQGDKKTSSLPFSLMLTAGPRGSTVSIRMGVDVPVGTASSNVTQTSNANSSNPRAVETARVVTEYRNIGTSIDSYVSRVDETNYSVYVNVSDSALFSADPGKIPTGTSDPAAFRTFSTQNTLPMKDGQTRLFGVATDKITGETLRIEVKLTILK